MTNNARIVTVLLALIGFSTTASAQIASRQNTNRGMEGYIQWPHLNRLVDRTAQDDQVDREISSTYACVNEQAAQELQDDLNEMSEIDERSARSVGLAWMREQNPNQDCMQRVRASITIRDEIQTQPLPYMGNVVFTQADRERMTRHPDPCSRYPSGASASMLRQNARLERFRQCLQNNLASIGQLKINELLETMQNWDEHWKAEDDGTRQSIYQCKVSGVIWQNMGYTRPASRSWLLEPGLMLDAICVRLSDGSVVAFLPGCDNPGLLLNQRRIIFSFARPERPRVNAPELGIEKTVRNHTQNQTDWVEHARARSRTDIMEWRGVITNRGSNAAVLDLEALDLLPIGLEPALIPGEGQNVRSSLFGDGWNLGTLQPGDSVVVRFFTRFTYQARGTMTNWMAADGSNVASVRDSAQVTIAGKRFWCFRSAPNALLCTAIVGGAVYAVTQLAGGDEPLKSLGNNGTPPANTVPANTPNFNLGVGSMSVGFAPSHTQTFEMARPARNLSESLRERVLSTRVQVTLFQVPAPF